MQNDFEKNKTNACSVIGATRQTINELWFYVNVALEIKWSCYIQEKERTFHKHKFDYQLFLSAESHIINIREI